MDDDKGLELSLGLSCGASSKKAKTKNGGAREESEPVIRAEHEFKSFLPSGGQKQESGTGSQSIRPSENFFSDMASKADASEGLNGEELWIANRLASAEEGKQPEASGKRKLLFGELNHHKRHEPQPRYTSLGENSKASHISIGMEDGSNADNEDAAESDADGSISRPISCDDDTPRQFIGIGGSLDTPKQVWPSVDSKVATILEQKRSTVSSENESKPRNQSHGNSFSAQSVKFIPYTLSTEEANTVGMPRSSSQPLHGITQMMSCATNEKFGSQVVSPGNFPAMSSYSPVQLPMLDKDNPWGMASQHSQFHPSDVSIGAPISGPVQPIVHNLSEVQHERLTSEKAKVDGNKHVAEESSSIRAEEMKGSSLNPRENIGTDRPIREGLPLDFSAIIRPGIAADLKFGGSGSYPNLPWVSTTGYGPHGRTISGVTYRLSTNQVRIVCACHGSHLSPEEFVRHASEEYIQDDNGLAAFAGTSPAAPTRT